MQGRWAKTVKAAADEERHVHEDDLLLFLKGSLEPKRVARIVEHLRACDPCVTKLIDACMLLGELTATRISPATIDTKGTKARKSGGSGGIRS